MLRTFDTPLTTNDQSIDRVLAAGLPVLLVFLDGAPPAGLAEALERLAREQAGRLLVVKVPVKDSPQARRRFGVQSFPALAAVNQRGETLAKAERVSAGELAQYAAYLLGRGPRPEAAQPPAAGQGERPFAAGAATPTHTTATPGAADRPVTVTEATFDQEVLRSPLPVVVDFWAPWCGPCRMIAPAVEKLAREQAGRVRYAKVNVDENPYVAQRYGVQSIPTMLVVKDGQIVDRWAGALPEAALRSRLAQHVR